jgi:hypothetical protein
MRVWDLAGNGDTEKIEYIDGVLWLDEGLAFRGE